MKKFFFQFLGLVILISIAIYFSSNSSSLNLSLFPQQTGNVKKTVTINDAKFNVEVADTPEKRAKGLGGRDSLDQDGGMLFIFSKEDKYSFWMKDTRFPLDIIWIKGDKIVDILTNAKPAQPNQKDETLPIFQPVVAVDKVLEVNAGTADRLQIRVGDTVKIE